MSTAAVVLLDELFPVWCGCEKCKRLAVDAMFTKRFESEVESLLL
jgi:hypothetical protein